MSDVYFEVVSTLGKRIRVTELYWNYIISKHTLMSGKELLVKNALISSSEVRRSRNDDSVFLYYRRVGQNFVVVVCKHLNGEGFIITTYVTDKIKIGEVVWQKRE